MKKIFSALLVAVCICMAMPAQAQINFGVKGGLNLSKASFSKAYRFLYWSNGRV